ncbi:Phospholipase D1 [Pleurotus pulmonarius]|nr:Phospholipase D1 [Pleurotus pulmonarius]
MSLSQIVELAREHNHRHDHDNHEDKHSDVSLDNSGDNSTPRLGQNDHQGTHSTKRNSTQYKSPPTTPSMRTGPPRSLSYTYSLPNSPATSRNNSKMVEQSEPRDILSNGVEEEGQYFPFTRREEFRGVLEYTASSEQSDRKGKKRDSRINDESWNPMRWFSESPKEEKPAFISDEEAKAHATEDGHVKGEGQAKVRDVEDPGAASEGEAVASPSSTNLASKLRRASSVPHSPQDKPKPGLANWGRLKSLLPNVVSDKHHAARTPGPSTVTHHSVNITDELITGGLSTLMLRLWFERDEKDHRRVPVLLHRLRIRVSDSLHPLHGNKSVYRIECEYANGAARWVIHRRLQDFISLHYHYAFSNAYNRNVENLPEFPRTSLPYFKFLKRESRDGQVGQADFARMQREVLENYLIELIRAVMFHPSANRLSGFFEISALFISLAQSGGAQYKGGYLRIEEAGNKVGGFGRKSAGWREKREQRWCVVRESYLVVLHEPGELTVWDVFLFDQDFKLERPKRYYRHPLNLLHQDGEGHLKPPEAHPRPQAQSEIDNKSVVASIKSKFSRVLSLGRKQKHPPMPNGNGNGIHEGPEDDDDRSISSSDVSSNPAPMLDPSTNVNPLGPPEADAEGTPRARTPAGQKKKKATSADVSKHTFFIENSQTRLKLFARNERQMLQWIAAFEKVKATSHWTGGNRFDSFAPIRLNVAAQWLVDGRDYFWNLSRAILLAKETIYIHDWWLSPELQMRRPNKERYRLDRLLERKAKEGVKIYIILYLEVSNRTTPTDSNYAKQRLASLHPNVMIQRSPSHFQTGTFYWAHHEKLCVIDQTIAFTGGVDLCFGRWDTPQHVLVDDIDLDSGASEIWPGKDYSNPRVMDFHALNKPEEDMYDRTKVPRMPWHDVGMQVVGEPARDLARHFVQRWNYLLRIKNHSRVMPFLLPPPEFKPGELAALALTGTCEMQICRSAGPWSLGTPGRIEHSIEHAYLKAIQLSEHFVYIENQFFITSTVANDVKVENRIGDALVHRIIRAHREGTPWKCCILIPLLPGFTFPVDHSDASAIRIILECQNRTISRGPNSIFGRLRKEGINPDDYISVFSLRNWAKMRGGVLTTEQVYIHGKVCIVDDRWVIIGSANINERSQRGDRDSELAAVIRDTDLLDCTMAGKPFKVGRFAHSLRVRLMREHLGVDVDALDEDDLMANEPVKPANEQEEWDPDGEQEHGDDEGVTRVTESERKTAIGNLAQATGQGIGQAMGAAVDIASELLRKEGTASNQAGNTTGYQALDDERQTFSRSGHEEAGFTSSVVPTLEERTVMEKSPAFHQADSDGDSPPQARTENGELFGAPAGASKDVRTDNEIPHARSGDTDGDDSEQAAPAAREAIRKHLESKLDNKTWTVLTPRPEVKVNGFEDPISDAFWKDVWVASASRNTEIFRKVFHAIPDDIVTTWKQYKEFVLHHERLNKAPGDVDLSPEPVGRVPSETGDEGAAPNPDVVNELDSGDGPRQNKDSGEQSSEPRASTSNLANEKDTKGRRSTRGVEPFEKWERDEMEKLLGELNGHLVVFPTRFLEGEDIANNFLFNADRLLPMPIYN